MKELSCFWSHSTKLPVDLRQQHNEFARSFKPVSDIYRTLIIVLAILSVPGCYPSRDSGTQVKPLRTVEIVKLAAESVEESVTLIGRIEPWRETTLYFEVTGVVSEVLVAEGDDVAPPQPIAQLELKDYHLAYFRARSELERALADLELLQAGTRKEDLQAARADLARAHTRTVFWSNEYKRVERLHRRSGTITRSEFDNVRQEYDAAMQTELMTKAALDKAVAGPRTEEIQAAAAEVNARKHAVAITQQQLGKATLKAPFRGRIEKRLVDPGAYINVFPTGGVPVVHLVDLENVDAVIAVPEELRHRFRVGDQLTVASAIRNEVRSAGKVISVGQIADRASGTYEVRVRMPNPERHLTGGMIVTMTIAFPVTESAIRIPVTTIRRAYGQAPYVMVVQPDAEGNIVSRRELELGSISGEEVTIRSGLTGGELLIVRGQHLVVGGDRVQYRTFGTPSMAQKVKSTP